ncbi:hypothetical protein [Rubrivirga sp.]|uniref:hypothetical protein n=1 Tax=Rubrivirga sp. TaxID=1885344 RepID=UPI003B515B1D
MHRSIPSDVLDLAPGLTAETVQALALRSVRRDSASSFQALLAAAAAAVRATLGPVGDAEAAALSLRQRETVAAVAADLGAVLDALASGVSDEARCLGRVRPADRVRAVSRPSPGWLPRLRERAAELAHASATPCPTWLAAAAAAVEALGQTAEHVATLASAQRPDSSARILGDRVADALRSGRDALLEDVARLVD